MIYLCRWLNTCMSSSFQTRKQSSSSERGSRKKDHNIYWGVLTIFEFFKNSTRKKPRNQFRHRPISGWWGHRPLDSVARKLGILYSIFFKRKGKKNISNFTLFSTLLFNASINTFIFNASLYHQKSNTISMSFSLLIYMA